MKTNTKNKKLWLGLILAVVGLVIIINIMGEETSVLVGNLVYIPIAGGLLVISTINFIHHRLKGIHGKAWLIFLLAATSWFVAEMTWIVHELILHEDPFPSAADYFYLAGYPLYFVFAILYLKPVLKGLEKRTIAIAIAGGFLFLIPTAYLTLDGDYSAEPSELFWGLSYPIADSIVLIPALLAVYLFFRGKVNLMWSMSLLGIFSLVIGDTGFLFLSLEDTYHTGHPIEIAFYWMYILFAIGVYEHMKLFKVEQKEKTTDMDKLRDKR